MSDCRKCIHFSESIEGEYYVISCNVFDDTTPLMRSRDCPKFRRMITIEDIEMYPTGRGRR